MRSFFSRLARYPILRRVAVTLPASHQATAPALNRLKPRQSVENKRIALAFNGKTQQY